MYSFGNVKKRTLEEIINEEMPKVGLNKTQLAERVGLSTSHFTNISNGKGTTKKTPYIPEPDKVNKLAKHLKTPIEEMLESFGFILSKDKRSLSPELTVFINEFEELSPTIQKQVLTIMSSIIEAIRQSEMEVKRIMENQTVMATINGKSIPIRFLEPIEKVEEILKETENEILVEKE